MSRAVVDDTADALVLQLLIDPVGRADPYPLYQQLRETAPVLRSSLGSLVLSTYDDCMTVLGDQRLGRGLKMRRDGGVGGAALSALDADPQVRDEFFDHAGHNMLFADAPDHTRLRRLASQAFTPARVRRLRPTVERMVDDLLDEIAQQPQVELISDVALPLPIRVIGELVGVPVEDRAAFQPLVRASTAGIEPGTSPQALRAAVDAIGELGAYFGELIARRRQEPADDLLTALAASGDADDRLSEQEIIATAILLFAAGFETTTNLIGNGMLALLQHPEQQQRWRDDQSVESTAVEELLRWDSPVQINMRTALQPCEAAGVPIAPGESVLLLQGGANRDPARFHDPESLDLTRDDNHPLSFGWGIHYCLGAALARMEGEVWFSRLLQRHDHITWLDDEPHWRPSFTLRGLEQLNVRFV
jgi:cytochrome P450